VTSNTILLVRQEIGNRKEKQRASIEMNEKKRKEKGKGFF